MSVDVGFAAAMVFALLIVGVGWMGHIGKVPEPRFGYFLGPPMMSVVAGGALVSFGLATFAEDAGMPGTASWLGFAGLVLGIAGFALAAGWRPGWAQPRHQRDQGDDADRGDLPPTA